MPLPPPNPPAEQQPADIPALMSGVDSELRIMRRAMAGYTKLNAVWDQMTNGLRQGERLVGIPQFKYTASDVSEVDGTRAIECIIELNKIPDPKYAPMILAAFCQIHGAEMIESVDRIVRGALLMQSQLYAALKQELRDQPTPPAQVQPAPAPGPHNGLPPVSHRADSDEDDEDEGEEVETTPRRQRPRRTSEQ